MQLDELIERLDGVKSSGEGGFVARCPAHDDRRQSLSLGLGTDERVLLKCHAGCHTDDICRALGVEAKDLFPAPSSNGKPKIIATYDYVDEQGTLLYQAVRFEPKDFRQRRPDGAGGWEWKTAGTRRVLYHLPEVLAAAAKGETVYVVEGEKDAEALIEYGHVATCNVGGAGKWRPEYSEALSGANVVIVADKDEPGRKHAFAVAAAVVGKAKDIKIVEAAQGKDAADHLEAGFTLNEFVACRGGQDTPTTSLPAITLADLMARAPERPEYVLYGYIAKGAITEIAAKPKVGKTRFVMEALSRILAGESFLGHATFKTRTLYLTEESVGTFVAGAKRSKLPSGDSCHVLMRGSVRSLEWDQICELAVAYCAQHNIGLVIVDTLSDWAKLRGDDENSAGAALAAMAPLRTLADAGCAVVAVRHEGKGVADIGEAARGSSAFAGSMDILVSLRRTRGRGNENRRELHAVGRFDETPQALTIDLKEHGYEVIMENANGRGKEVESKILEIMPMAEDWAISESDICGQLEATHSTVGRALSALAVRGVIKLGKQQRRDGRGPSMVTVYWRGEE